MVAVELTLQSQFDAIAGAVQSAPAYQRVDRIVHRRARTPASATAHRCISTSAYLASNHSTTAQPAMCLSAPAQLKARLGIVHCASAQLAAALRVSFAFQCHASRVCVVHRASALRFDVACQRRASRVSVARQRRVPASRFLHRALCVGFARRHCASALRVSITHRATRIAHQHYASRNAHRASRISLAPRAPRLAHRASRLAHRASTLRIARQRYASHISLFCLAPRRVSTACNASAWCI